MASRIYIVATIPAPAREAAESAVSPFLLSPNDKGVFTFSVPLVPLAGPPDADPTAYGVCAAAMDDSGLYQSLPALSAGIPGTAYKVVSPWKTFDLAADWTGWLAAAGLQTQQRAEK